MITDDQTARLRRLIDSGYLIEYAVINRNRVTMRLISSRDGTNVSVQASSVVEAVERLCRLVDLRESYSPAA